VTRILFAPVVETTATTPELKRKQEKLRNRIDSVNRLRERLIVELNEVTGKLGETPGQDETKRICGE
jgi:chaperonin cofactor prefoldin